MATFPIERDDQRAILAANILMIAVPVVAVSLRLLSRRIAKRALNISDYLMVAAVVCECVSASLSSLSITGVVQCGLGYDHMANIIQNYGPEPITLLLKGNQLLIGLQFTWVISLSLCKISILLLYRKLFPTPLIHWASLATSCLIAAWAIATIMAGCLICQPISKNWDLTMTDGHCGDQVLSFTITGVINLITDVMVLVLPLPNLYKLQVPIQQRVVLVGVFSLGFLTCAVSAVRIHYLSSMDYSDLTFSMKYSNIFSGLEPSAAITLACIPLMRPLFRWSGGYSPTGTALDPKSSSSASSRNSGNKGVSKSIPSKTPNNNRNRNKNNDEDGYGDGSSQVRLRPDNVKHTVMATGHPRHGGGGGSSDGGSSMAAESFVEDEDDEKEGHSRHRSGNHHHLERPGITVRQQWDVTKQ
ncbi:hypothetical protein PG993_003836 [Apiospora rasikravindrae]|uniref:Rhodopsin domain-containing protein n=1 Tax=Apiospora rasikravindrae TaxID=990691 RepID=A0ABR1U0L5_9PEZI